MSPMNPEYEDDISVELTRMRTEVDQHYAIINNMNKHMDRYIYLIYQSNPQRQEQLRYFNNQCQQFMRIFRKISGKYQNIKMRISKQEVYKQKSLILLILQFNQQIKKLSANLSFYTKQRYQFQDIQRENMILSIQIENYEKMFKLSDSKQLNTNYAQFKKRIDQLDSKLQQRFANNKNKMQQIDAEFKISVEKQQQKFDENNKKANDLAHIENLKRQYEFYINLFEYQKKNVNKIYQSNIIAIQNQIKKIKQFKNCLQQLNKYKKETKVAQAQQNQIKITKQSKPKKVKKDKRIQH